GPVPRHGDRRGLAEPHRALRGVDGPAGALRGRDRGCRADAHLGEPAPAPDRGGDGRRLDARHELDHRPGPAATRRRRRAGTGLAGPGPRRLAWRPHRPEPRRRTERLSAMDRLPFVLPDFTRQMWVGDAARTVWAPRLRRITQAWLEIEWLAVADGARACAVTAVSPGGLVERAATWLGRGLNVLPLEIQGTGGTYASTAVATELGKPFVYRVVVGRPEDLRAFQRAWEANDQAAIGRLLGYPPCCFAFFRRVWVDD